MTPKRSLSTVLLAVFLFAAGTVATSCGSDETGNAAPTTGAPTTAVAVTTTSTTAVSTTTAAPTTTDAPAATVSTAVAPPTTAAPLTTVSISDATMPPTTEDATTRLLRDAIVQSGRAPAGFDIFGSVTQDDWAGVVLAGPEEEFLSVLLRYDEVGGWTVTDVSSGFFLSDLLGRGVPGEVAAFLACDT